MKDNFTILVADDDIDDQALVKEGLHQFRPELNVVQVYDGIRVMDYLLRREKFKEITDPPDLILLDLNMPLMDGFETLQAIKKHPHLRPIPIYVITTTRDTDHLSKALNLGANGVYTKGVKSEDIAKIVREVCGECFEDSPQDE